MLRFVGQDEVFRGGHALEEEGEGDGQRPGVWEKETGIDLTGREIFKDVHALADEKVTEELEEYDEEDDSLLDIR